MKTDLLTAQREYNNYFERTVFPLLNITTSELDDLGFAEIAERIEAPQIRRTFRKLAVALLEANLQDHQADRPNAAELLKAGNSRDLKDWQEFSAILEKALMALVSQGDT
jgi:hypothetical protein